MAAPAALRPPGSAEALVLARVDAEAKAKGRRTAIVTAEDTEAQRSLLEGMVTPRAETANATAIATVSSAYGQRHDPPEAMTAPTTSDSAIPAMPGTPLIAANAAARC